MTPVETLWGLALNNALIAPPAYDGTRAFFPIEGDRLVAYDLITGAQDWMISAQSLAQPAAGGGLLFVLEPDFLRAFHAADGSLAWQIPFAEKLAARPVWDNGWLIVASARGEIGALRASDGQLVWRRDLKSPAHAAPALAADRVYIPTSDGRIVALRVETGEPLWERRLGDAPNDILALDQRIYVGAQDNFFYCVMAEDGRVDWRWRTGGDVIGTPAADNRLVYFVALDNVLRAMNLVTGGQQWMRPLPLRPVAGPVLAGSSVVVTGQAAPLRVYNVKDGTVAGTGTLTAALAAPKRPPFTLPVYYGFGDPPLVDLAAIDLWRILTATIPPEVGPPPPAILSIAIAPDVEIAAPPHVVVDPTTRLPMVVIVTRDLAKGAAVALVRRDIEPTLIPAVAALPNLIQIAPVTPTTPPLRP